MAAKLKFGVRLNIQGEMGAKSSGFDYTLEMARLAESLGFDSVGIPDHVENAHLDRPRYADPDIARGRNGPLPATRWFLCRGYGDRNRRHHPAPEASRLHMVFGWRT